MSRREASFTFLHRVKEVELNLEDGRWQSALALALTLPDICGGIAFPDLIKRYRDGRPMLDRQKNPVRDVGSQYIRWFDEYAGEFFKASSEDQEPYICGERCWQLRCEYLHQNKGFLNDEGEVRFHLGLNCGTSLCQLDRSERQSKRTDIRIDIEQFCQRMCRASRSYYEKVYREKDFSLYNTPVLDFIRSGEKTGANPLIVILCKNERYARGIAMALSAVTGQLLLCRSTEEVKKQLGKRKPVLWVVTEEFTRETEQPWRSGSGRPVVLLMRNSSETEQMDKKEGRLAVLTFPVRPEELRRAVISCLP